METTEHELRAHKEDSGGREWSEQLMQKISVATTNWTDFLLESLEEAQP